MSLLIAGFKAAQKYWFQCPVNELKKLRGKNRVCGPYYTTRKLIESGAHPGRSFYLDSDFQPFTRWIWCDEAKEVNINHTGWFCDEYQDEKIRGIVARLPHGRFLAGWSMGEGMASEVDGELYNDEGSAALAADSMAEDAAEREREYQEEQEEERRKEEENQGQDEEETEGY